jgi:hypothetical protein
LIGLYLPVIFRVVGWLELVWEPDRKEFVRETWEFVGGDADFPVLRLASALPVVVMVPLMTIGRLCGTLVLVLVTMRP